MVLKELKPVDADLTDRGPTRELLARHLIGFDISIAGIVLVKKRVHSAIFFLHELCRYPGYPLPLKLVSDAWASIQWIEGSLTAYDPAWEIGLEPLAGVEGHYPFIVEQKLELVVPTADPDEGYQLDAGLGAPDVQLIKSNGKAVESISSLPSLG